MQFDEIMDAYWTTALWASTTDDGEPFDRLTDIVGVDRIAADEEVDAFLQRHAGLVAEFEARGGTAGEFGHQLWLTRNRHGSGFWDCGLGELGDLLTEACHALGEKSLWHDEDGWIRAR